MRRLGRLRLLATLGMAALVSGASTGCMFRMQHELPLNAYLNHEPGGARRRAFDDEGMKNWALAGLVPYSDFGAKDLVESTTGREVSDLSVKTEFTGLDTLIWVIPGFAYGYYLWAPRHVKVSGEYVDGAAPPALPATR